MDRESRLDAVEEGHDPAFTPEGALPCSTGIWPLHPPKLKKKSSEQGGPVLQPPQLPTQPFAFMMILEARPDPTSKICDPILVPI